MSNKAILITGDFVLDYHIYEGRRHHYGENLQSGVKVIRQLGGAAVVHQILDALLKPDSSTGPADSLEWKPFLAVQDVSNNGLGNAVDPSQYAYAFWRPFPGNAAPDKQFWRVSEGMGFGAGDTGRHDNTWQPAENLPKAPEVVVLSEGGMGFREDRDRWPHSELNQAKCIVLKTASPIGEGQLWEQLAPYRDRLVVVVTAYELRKTRARLNAGLSWETSVEDVMRELDCGGSLHELTRCRHLIVAFDSEGALWLDRRDQKENAPLAHSHAHLVFDSRGIEGDHAYNINGKAFGFLSCLTAALTRQITINSETPDFAEGLEGGLSAMRDLRDHGHGLASEAPLGFPAVRIAEVIKRPTSSYSRARFDCFQIGGGQAASQKAGAIRWSLLSEAQRHHNPAYELARLVLLRGPIALANLPHLRIGNLISVERTEVEVLRTLIQVLRRYKLHDAGKKPLSIGVFGPPGAGKSFAVREIASNIVGKEGWMEFNLAQFNTADDLIGAFHQIRDQVLMGRLPVAFFDEFDSQKYRWLQYLLAPLQEGQFQEGQLTHSLGKCVFIFAGGTSWTFETFGPPPPAPGSSEQSEPHRDFRLAKGPDFHSRIDAYLNVAGPNQRRISPPPHRPVDEAVTVVKWHLALDPDDIYFPIRRALMIRTSLKCTADDKLVIDEGLVRGLLRVKEYTHGSRSLDKVLQPLAAARPGPLHRSLILPSSQLAMHTNAEEFIRLCSEAPVVSSQDSPLNQEQIKEIAPAIHETWRELGRKEGWLEKKLDTDFDHLPGFGEDKEFYRESNRAAAGRMLDILDLAGLRLVKIDAAAKEAEATKEAEAVRQHLEYHLDALAEAEHDEWMNWHLAKGWRYAPTKEEGKPVHPCLLPFSQLPKRETDKDRESIRHYPDFAAKAGMKMMFADDE